MADGLCALESESCMACVVLCLMSAVVVVVVVATAICLALVFQGCVVVYGASIGASIRLPRED